MVQLYATFIKADGIFQFTYGLYVSALLAYACSHFGPCFKDGKDRIYQAARILFLAAWLLNAFLLLQRGIAAGRVPAKTYYESLIYFSFIFGLLALAVEWTKKVRLLGFLSLLVVWAALTYALAKADIEIITLPPALQSAWFLPHVTIYFTGYASLTVAFVLGILALATPGDRRFEPGSFWARALGATEVNFEKMNRQWIRFGFLMLACGLITGGTWAKFAWSDYWAWDPKENWGLISWLVYGAVLHMHYAPAYKGRKAVWASVFAWGFVLFTYFGMGKLPTKGQSMHLYTEPPASGEGETVNGVNKQMY
ncbi:MAG: cytochrome c biogenesis protein CcsA [Holophagaceae bacterium]|nr:cytochrome c biogenesis protein CcsA [Holophagaceae bacterium]